MSKTDRVSMHSPVDRGEASMLNHDHTHTQDHPATLALLGGDARQLAVSAFLAEAGYEIRLMGLGDAEDGALSPPIGPPLPKGIKVYHRLDRALEGASAIVLPYPATKDGATVFCPLDTHHTITLAEVGAHVQKHPEVRVFGGRMPAPWVSKLRTAGCLITDYEDSEAFLIKNARLTAEGAIMTAMELTDTALLGAPMAVIGYGRIGQLLAHLLTVLGARVTVVARREESRAEAAAMGCHTLPPARMTELCTGYEVIFNTVPAVMLDKALLTALPCRTKIIELASAPGGLDPEGVTEATRRCGLQVIRAPSLPGRYAPKDAGEAIAACILSVMEEVSL